MCHFGYPIALDFIFFSYLCRAKLTKITNQDYIFYEKNINSYHDFVIDNHGFSVFLQRQQDPTTDAKRQL